MSVLRLVAENPFRVLGVYANARPADIVSNCDEMEAYLSINQSVHFDLDFDNLMPKVKRTSQTVEQAKIKTNLPKDKLKHSFFWFFKNSTSSHAETHLKNGDLENANSVFEIDDSFSSYINTAIVAFLKGDYSIAVRNITTLIHDEENNYRDDFVNAVCGKTFQISEDELAHLFIDALLEEITVSKLTSVFQEFGVSSEDDNYLKEKAVAEPIAYINKEIAKAKSVGRDADDNYEAGLALMENTKTNLRKIKGLLDADDMQYQIVADDLAETILQCGINYYNGSDDDDDIEKALVLQEYACKIAVGSITKERCDKNVEILKRKRKEKLIEDDLAYLVSQLETFRGKSESIYAAKTLVNNCAPHLQNIKKQGINDLYIKLSSAVANNALGMIVSVVNDIQRNSSSIDSIQSTIESAMSAMAIIGKLDMTSDERSHFTQNKETLQHIYAQISLHKITEEAKAIDYYAQSRTNYSSNYSSSRSSSSSDGCYIATMCYGDYDHPQVLVLRDFRDTVLRQYEWGRKFIGFYYKHSPIWVEHLKDKKLINNIIRKSLDNFITLYRYVKK